MCQVPSEYLLTSTLFPATLKESQNEQQDEVIEDDEE